MSQLFLPAVVSALALFASLTNGQVPTAVVSVVSDSDYATARPCIQTCIWYNGGLGRGGNSGFQDVGKALGCGQMPINACYCSDRLTASATSYFSVCISSLCTAATDPADLSSALSIYGRYCSTAGVVEAAPTTTSAGTSTSPGSSTRTSVASTSGDRSSSGQTGQGQTPKAASSGSGSSTSSSTGNSPQDTGGSTSSSSGLSTTSKIALGVGLGVGIPVLLLLAAIFFLLLRKRRNEETSTVGGIETRE